MASFRACVNKACKQCIYDPVGGTGSWRKQVEGCTDTKCGLYPVRPKPTTTAELGDPTQVVG